MSHHGLSSKGFTVRNRFLHDDILKSTNWWEINLPNSKVRGKVPSIVYTFE
jgi:hypothetical protein